MGPMKTLANRTVAFGFGSEKAGVLNITGYPIIQWPVSGSVNANLLSASLQLASTNRN